MTSTTDAAPEPTAPSPGKRRRRRVIVIGVLTVVAALVVFVLVVFQPQKLFIDDVVNEDLPGLVTAGGPTDDPAASTPSTTAGEAEMLDDEAAAIADPLAAAADEATRRGVPVSVTTGTFVSLDHPTSGTALLVVQPDGSRLLRIEDLDTDNGPDLHVVLSTAAVGTGDYGSLIELGGLKGNVGDQNYEIPAEVDLATVQSVVIWCERFSAPFGEAPLALPT